MLLAPLWCVLPAYLANSSAVLWGGGIPVDLGRRFPDGRRILGDGKTYRGFAGGMATGLALALVLNELSPLAGMPLIPLAAAVAFSAGALLGDSAASLLKRRLGLRRGRPAPGLDQLDFLIGALSLAYLVAPDWFVSVYTVVGTVEVVAVTVVVHVSVNFFAYRTGLKAEPW